MSDLVFEWGASADRPLVGDFDGDGKTDVTVYRPSTGEWFIRYSSRGFSSSAFGYFQWGAADDVTVQADYDGDGATDVGVYRPSTGYWYLRYSSEAFVAGSTSHPWTFLLGGPGLAPHARDVDGDGRTDMTVVGSPVMNWHLIPSPFGSSPAGVFLGAFGATGDVVLP